MAVLIAILNPADPTVLSFLADAPALVQVMVFFLTWTVCWLPIAAGLAIALKWQPFQVLTPQQKLPLVVSLYLIFPLILWGFCRLSKATIYSYGLALNWGIIPAIGLGFSMGVLSLVVVFLGQIWLGWCSWEAANTKQLIPVFLPILLVALLVGGIEELCFRGFVFTQLWQDYPLWVSATLSSLIFAILHLIWEQKETIPQLPGLWLMGMVLVLARLVNGGSLGLAWGLHAGWVWAIASIETAEVISYTGKISQWVTGKDKKPLAGAAGVVCLLLTGMVLWVLSAE